MYNRRKAAKPAGGGGWQSRRNKIETRKIMYNRRKAAKPAGGGGWQSRSSYQAKQFIKLDKK